jgi:L-alanine-DL-glutamate epimerase-like enolase superfamily enzyme
VNELKIARVEATQLQLTERPHRVDSPRSVRIVQITTDDGLTGLGEILSLPLEGEANLGTRDSPGDLFGLGQVLSGMDAGDIPAVRQAICDRGASSGRSKGDLTHLMSGIELAQWDLRGKSAGLPVCRLASTQPPRGVRAYTNVTMGSSIEEALTSAGERAAQGFRALKFRLGPCPTTLDQELALLSGARALVGSHGELMLRVDRKWDLEDAVERCTRFAAFNLRWIEEPLQPDDLDGYKRLSVLSGVPIAGAETAASLSQFEAYLDAGIDVVQPDIARCGLALALKVAAIAKERGGQSVPRFCCGGIHATAALHLASAMGGEFVEHPSEISLLYRGMVRGFPELHADGTLIPSDRPGLGISLGSNATESPPQD